MSTFDLESFLNIKSTNLDSNEQDLNFNISQNPDNSGSIDLSQIGTLVESNPYISDLPIISQGQVIVQIRKMIASNASANKAADEIVSESIVPNEDIKLKLKDLKFSDEIIQRVNDEFHNILSIINFKNKGREYIRRFLVDGVIFAQKIINTKSPKLGIQEIRIIDPLYIRKVINPNGVSEFRYSNMPFTDTSIDRFSVASNYFTLDNESVAYAFSGVMDGSGRVPVSVFFRALKAWRTLDHAEDSMLVNRVARAGEKKVFYVGIGNMSPKKAGALVKEIKTSQTRKVQYDPETGEFTDKNAAINLSENYFIPRSSDGNTTEISTLPGAENTDKIGDVEYFKDKFHRSLIIPFSRLSDEPTGNPFGARSEEISREEVIFNGFITDFQSRFGEWLIDILITQLLLKNVVSTSDVSELRNNIKVDFPVASNFNELKNLELISIRNQAILEIMPLIDSGFYTKEWVFENILKLSDEEIQNMMELKPASSLP